jgi:hypothetical protein
MKLGACFPVGWYKPKVNVYDTKRGRPVKTRHAFLRGGNWNNTSNAGAFTANLNNTPGNTNNNIGFRCASDLTHFAYTRKVNARTSGVYLRIHIRGFRITAVFSFLSGNCWKNMMPVFLSFSVCEW